MDMYQTEPLNSPEAALVAPVYPAKRFFTGKVLVWAVLAGLAATYLAMLTVNPGAIAAYLPAAIGSGNPEDNQGQRATMAANPEEMRDSIDQLKLDVAQIKSSLAEKADQDKAIETRLATLEDIKRGGGIVAATSPAGTSPPAGSVQPVAAPGAALVAPAQAPITAAVKAATKKAAAAVAKPVAPAAAVAAVAAIAPVAPAAIAPAVANAAAVLAPPLATADVSAGAAGVKLINAPLSASTAASKAAPAAPAAIGPAQAPAPSNAAAALAPKLETGSVQNLNGAAAPSVTGAKPVGIYIGSGPSVDSLRLSWNLLSDRNPDSLKPLQPRYTTGIDANGLNYGLVAGPLNSAADAQKVCKDLAARAVTCRVGDFTGEAL